MKMMQMVGWAALFASGMAQGGEAERSGQAVPNASALGLVEALVGTCAKVDPASAGKYDGFIQQMVQGQSDQALAALRGTDDYIQSHDGVLESLANVDQLHVKQTCAESLLQLQ